MSDAQPAVDAVANVTSAITQLDVAIDASIHAFVARAREERKQRRAVLVRSDARATFSPYVLIYRVNKGYAELVWSEIFYIKGSNKPRYRRVPCSDGGTHFHQIIKRAHPEEVDLIRSHEVQARAYRKLWSTFVVGRREFGKCATATQRVADLANDPMVLESR